MLICLCKRINVIIFASLHSVCFSSFLHHKGEASYLILDFGIWAHISWKADLRHYARLRQLRVHLFLLRGLSVVYLLRCFNVLKICL